MDNLSIIIRNRNEAEYIGFALQSICDFIPKVCSIVIIVIEIHRIIYIICEKCG